MLQLGYRQATQKKKQNLFDYLRYTLHGSAHTNVCTVLSKTMYSDLAMELPPHTCINVSVSLKFLYGYYKCVCVCVFTYWIDWAPGTQRGCIDTLIALFQSRIVTYSVNWNLT